jgi:hypothetical protein
MLVQLPIAVRVGVNPALSGDMLYVVSPENRIRFLSDWEMVRSRERIVPNEDADRRVGADLKTHEEESRGADDRVTAINRKVPAAPIRDASRRYVHVRMMNLAADLE